MQVLASWKRSLKLCSPAALKMFALLTLKAMGDALYTLMAPWFLIVCGIGVLVYAVCASTVLYAVIGTLLSTMLSVIFLIAARPSIERKDFAYFRKNVVRVLKVFPLFTITWLCLIAMLFVILLIPLLSAQSILSISMALVKVIFMILCIPSSAIMLASLFAAQEFTFLFYLDRTEGAWKATKRALKMVWYNLPAILVYTLLFIGTSLCTWLLFYIPFSSVGIPLFSKFLSLKSVEEADSFMQNNASLLAIFNIVSRFISQLGNLLYICLVTNLYIKLVHDQYELYFPEDTQNG